MNGVWQLKEAEDNFGEVIEEAIRSGPQIIEKHDKEAVIIISLTEYRKMTEGFQKLSAFFRESPLANLEVSWERDKSGLRPDFAL
jgi:prevent-host-death family protein